MSGGLTGRRETALGYKHPKTVTSIAGTSMAAALLCDQGKLAEAEAERHCSERLTNATAACLGNGTRTPSQPAAA